MLTKGRLREGGGPWAFIYQKLFLRFKNRYKKKGTPMKEVMTPTGSMTGAMMVLATVSAARSSNAPKSPEAGMRYFARL